MPTTDQPHKAPPPYADPIAEGTVLPTAMVAAALSQSNGGVAVLSGSLLETWATATIDHALHRAIPRAVAKARASWTAEVAQLAEQAAAAAVRQHAEHWDRLSLAAASGRVGDNAEETTDQETVRRNVVLPALVAADLKATSAALGMTQQEAFSEALRLWLRTKKTTGTSPTQDNDRPSGPESRN